MLETPNRSLLRSPARFRRIATGTLLVLAPLLSVVAAVVDPGTWGDDREVVSYADNPALAQLESVLYHWSWLLMAVAMIGMVHLMRRRAVVFGHVVGTLAVLGAINASALMMSDPVEWWFGRHYPAEEATRLTGEVLNLPGVIFGFQMPWMFLAIAGVPLLVAGVWRAGFAPWWAPLLAAAGYVGMFVLPYGPASIATLALTVVALGTVARSVFRMDDAAWAAL